jgi:hypothetical protein
MKNIISRNIKGNEFVGMIALRAKGQENNQKRSRKYQSWQLPSMQTSWIQSASKLRMKKAMNHNTFAKLGLKKSFQFIIFHL